MVENIERHLHAGHEAVRGARHRGARELVGPIIAMTITLAAVYTPVGIQGGLTGALFREFAFTLAGAVIVSGVVALTLSPMMGSKLLRTGDTERGFAGFVNRRFERVRTAYARTLRRHPALPAGGARRCGASWWCWPCPSTCSRRRSSLPSRTRASCSASCRASANSTLDQTKLFTDQGPRRLPLVPGDGEHLPDHRPHRRLLGHGHEAVERAHARPPRSCCSRSWVRSRRSPASA